MSSLLIGQSRVIVAIMLRNIRTRFFAHGVGFLVSIGWPFAHIILLLLINAFFDRAPPYGDSLVLFISTGIVPFICFQYMSRFILITVLHTRPLLAFPAVKIADMLIAGAILETLSTCTMIIILLISLTAIGVDVVPPNIPEAATALAVSMLLGFGYGAICALAGMANPVFVTASALSMILLYMTSGIFFLPSAMPETLRYYLSFNPLLQSVEWMRSAYYEGYSSVLDKTYTLAFVVVLIFLGLACERLFRGRFLSA